MFIYSFKKCPKCDKKYKVKKYSLEKKYTTPIAICPYCKYVFIDESCKEIAISGIDKKDKSLFTIKSLVFNLVILVFGIILLISDFYAFGSIFIGVFCLLIFYQFIFYASKKKKLKALEQQSINRMNDEKYVTLLIQYGVSIPKEYLEKHNIGKNDKPIKDVCKKALNNSFDVLMTGQLVALYKTTHNQEYSNEYERRLQHVGFTLPESKSLFMLELMMLKHDHIPVLTDDKYLTNNYFNLNTPVFPLENSYYVEHQTFLVSEITKIWDEAEWIWTYRKSKITSADALNEIFKITRYGGGELLVETLKSIAEHSNIDFAKIQKYSVSEQDMMFKYKWYKDKNEKHPYY